jgi:hypothetical protein
MQPMQWQVYNEPYRYRVPKKGYGGEYTLHTLHNLQRSSLVIYSLHALILRNGNVVRSGIARPETVTRYLLTVGNLADYQVWYRWRSQPRRMTAEGFLALYEAGRIPRPRPLREMETELWPSA